MQQKKYQAILLGVAASMLFSLIFILNRLMSLNGSSWIWSSSMRFYWMLLLFLIIVWYRGGIKGMWEEIKNNSGQWLIWSTIGFGLFYAPLTFAAAYAPSWLLAGTWQFTIIAGMILAPFINRDVTGRNDHLGSAALFSGIILLGIIIMHVKHAQIIPAESVLKGVIPALIAAFAYPSATER